MLYRSSNQSAAVPEPTMLFAALCLRNALYIVKSCLKTLSSQTSPTESATTENTDQDTETDDQDKSKSETIDWMHVNDNGCCNPSGLVNKDTIEKLRCSIYAASSYVSLRLGDYVTALGTAKELLRMEKISDAYK